MNILYFEYNNSTMYKDGSKATSPFSLSSLQPCEELSLTLQLCRENNSLGLNIIGGNRVGSSVLVIDGIKVRGSVSA